MDGEIWKDIPNYEGVYQISNLGRCRSVDRNVYYKDGRVRFFKGRILCLRINPGGRYYVTLSSESKVKTFKIHKLVAMAFLNHTPCGYKEVVDHINNNPLDNRLENLCLTTQRHNASKDRKNKSSIYTGVSFCKTRNKWVAEIRIGSKRINLGAYNIEKDAHQAYVATLKSQSSLKSTTQQ